MYKNTKVKSTKELQHKITKAPSTKVHTKKSKKVKKGQIQK